jgi:hypothetical protein
MGRDPVCPLCSGRLERQRDVTIQAGGSNVLAYTAAWVCADCSAAFPIAVGRGGVSRGARPLYVEREPRE